MADDFNQDDDAPELRKLLDKMHGEELSVFDEIGEEEQLEPVFEEPIEEEVPVYKSTVRNESIVSDESTVSNEDRVEKGIVQEVEPVESSEYIPEGVIDMSVDDAEDELSTQVESVVEEVQSMPVFVEEEQVEEEQVEVKQQVDTSFHYQPAPELEQLTLHAEPSFVTPPESVKPDLDRLPVTLDCSLRSLPKTLGEVSQMRVGEIITLGCGLDAPIDLKANGRVFATGRLVMVEDQLAVEVIDKLGI